MTTCVRLLGGICLSAIVLGIVAPGVFTPFQNQQPNPIVTSPGSDSQESLASGSTQESLRPFSPSATANSPLFGALEGVVEQNGELLGAYGDHLQQQLVDADETFRKIQQENSRAIQQAGRRQRIPGRSPHVVLILIPGLTTDILRCYNPSAQSTPGFDHLAQMGTRLISLESSGAGGESHWTHLMNHGSTERTGKAGNLISHIWSAGYDTHWFGDVSQLPADPLVLGFETWVGFRDSHEASIPEPTHFWTNGRKIVLEHQAETDQLERLSPAEMLLNATVRTLKSHQRSRPVLAVSFIAPREATAAQFDTIPLRMIELLDQTGLFASTVLVVAGVPTGSDSQRAPCFIIWPRHDSGGAVVETPANWSDVAATIGEVTEVPTSRLGFGGESQLKLWRPD